MFHLITHAFFKALLFMGAGSIIHGMEHGHHEIAHGHHGHHDDGFDPQDMRFMGGLRRKMPVTFWTYLVGALALAGIFPFAGFWSKDEILAHAYANQTEYAIFQIIFIMLLLAAMCTAFYMGRQLRMVFWGKPRHEAAAHAHESSPIMTFPLVLLAAFGVVAGLFNLPRLLNWEYDQTLVLEHWLEHSIQTFELIEEGILPAAPHTPTSLIIEVASLSLALALLSLGAAFLVYRNKPQTASDPDPTQKIPGLWTVFGRLPVDSFYMKLVVPWFNRFSDWLGHKFEWRFWHDFVHDNIIRDTFVWFADVCANILDAQGVDGLVNGLGSATKWMADGIRVSQTGYARTYALGVFLGAVALLVYFLWPYIMN
jgi:NADH-quinone oxidoreductase subunit L